MILELQNTIAQAKKAKQELAEIILSLEDNPKIQRIEGAVNCFVMSSKDLNISKNLSPLYYDFKIQYQKIVQRLDNVNLEHYIIRLAEILSEKKVRYSGSPERGIMGNYHITLNDKVIENILNKLGEPLKELVEQKREEKKEKDRQRRLKSKRQWT